MSASSCAGPPHSAAMSRDADPAGRSASPIIPAATGIARSARDTPARTGLRAQESYCRFPISTWCSRYRRGRRDRFPEQGGRLRHPVPDGGRDAAHDRRRSRASRRRDRPHRGAAQLGQSLHYHPHIHCIVPGGGISPRRHPLDFLPAEVLPARACAVAPVSTVLSRTTASGPVAGDWASSAISPTWQSPMPCPLACRSPQPGTGRLRQAAIRGPKQVLAYLGRYTHRIAIANSRLIGMEDDRVAFRWKDYRRGGRTKVMTLDAHEFIRRSCCTRCRTAFIASAITASSPTAIALPSSTCAEAARQTTTGRAGTGCEKRRLSAPCGSHRCHAVEDT